MNEQSSNIVYNIPSDNFSKFEEKWNKLVKRANKLAIIPPTYSMIGESIKPHKVLKERYNSKINEYEKYYENMAVLYYHITIFNPVVKVADWTFVASLEHTNEGTIIHNISGKDLPEEYRSADAECHHCKVNRYRKQTYVLFNNQEYKQVGSTCLTDFLGVDGSDYASAAEIYGIANELVIASQGFSGSGELYDYLDTYLAHVAEVISINGWLSRSSARELDRRSTSDIAYMHLHPPFYGKSEKLYEYPTDKSVEIAKKAIEWCENLSDEEVEASEYLHNIRVIAKRGVVGPKQFGYAASIVSAYQRLLIDQINKDNIKKDQANSQYVGEIGKRQNFKVLVEKVLQLNGAYGVSHMHIMRDDQGNRLTWFSSSKVLDTGVMLNIKATPKKHEEYKGIKQTIITRCITL